jgi:hypothetical protein
MVFGGWRIRPAVGLVGREGSLFREKPSLARQVTAASRAPRQAEATSATTGCICPAWRRPRRALGPPRIRFRGATCHTSRAARTTPRRVCSASPAVGRGSWACTFNRSDRPPSHRSGRDPGRYGCGLLARARGAACRGHRDRLSRAGSQKRQLATPQRTCVPVPFTGNPSHHAAARIVEARSQRILQRQGSALRMTSQPRTRPPSRDPNTCWGRGQHVLGCAPSGFCPRRVARYTPLMPTEPRRSRGPLRADQRKGEGGRLR